mmetsp:Transcript_10376/g.28254  ORF Transcript_10376/g.28254 Transcript_10376/m.28254 type:complete len:229 (+) Transcript_10376:66-752(+)
MNPASEQHLTTLPSVRHPPVPPSMLPQLFAGQGDDILTRWCAGCAPVWSRGKEGRVQILLCPRLLYNQLRPRLHGRKLARRARARHLVVCTAPDIDVGEARPMEPLEVSHIPGGQGIVDAPGTPGAEEDGVRTSALEDGREKCICPIARHAAAAGEAVRVLHAVPEVDHLPGHAVAPLGLRRRGSRFDAALGTNGDGDVLQVGKEARDNACKVGVEDHVVLEHETWLA